MTKIDIYSGFLGAGKTTLIKKLVKEAYAGQKIVIIENEFGEIGIDGGFLKDAGVEIKEMNSGCICCSLTGDFKKALAMVAHDYNPDRIIIEPSGVGKLSDVAAAVMATENTDFVLGGLTTVVDASKCKMYLKNFGEFFDDQVKAAHCIVLSRSSKLSSEKIEDVAVILKEMNPEAVLVTADWNELDGKEILKLIDGRNALTETMEALLKEHEEDDDDDDDDCCCHHGHHHHHDDDDDDHECCHHHHHDEDDDDHECCHHHHHDDDDDDDHDHECCHHHHHDEDDDDDHECCHHHHDEEGHEHHHHHHHHDADEVFTSWGRETAKRFTEDDIKNALKALEDSEKYGMVLRAKGIVENANGGWIHFDYTPGEPDVRKGPAAATGLLCVIGAKISEEEIEKLFGVK